jgi:CubicO group peptidase (beta-lactamase class C family)
MKYFRILCFVSLLSFCLGPGAIASYEKAVDYSTTIEQTTAFIERRMREDQVTGISIALVDGQKTVWSQGFGFADKEKGLQASPETIYEIGSISKTITATAIMRLQEQGLISIDHPLTEYLPEFSILPPLGFPPDSDKPITIRTILTHHSGLPGDLFNGGFTLKPRTDYNAWVLKYLREEYACYPPDFIWAYSNTAFSLLSEVISRVSGQSFQEYTDGLFQKMGMHLSSYFDKPAFEEDFARGYFQEEPLERFYDNMWTAGSVLSNVTDMARFIKMVLGAGGVDGVRILKPETLAEMLTAQNEDIPLDLDLRQGLSWVLMDRQFDDAGRVCHHTGSTHGFLSHIEILPDHQIGVVVLSNTQKAMIAIEAARMALKLALKDKTGMDLSEPPGPTHSPYTTWAKEELEVLAGIYATEAGYDIMKAVPGGLEWWSSYGEETRKLMPLENGRFALPDSQELQVEFSKISGREVMVFHEDALFGLVGRSLWAERYEPVSVPASWLNRLGKYEVSNLYPDDCLRYLPEKVQDLSGSVELAVKDGILVLGCTIQGNSLLLVLEPINDTVAKICALGRDKGGAVQMMTVNGEEQIQLWGSLYKKP